MKKVLMPILIVPLLLIAFGKPALGRPQSGTKFFFDGTTSQGLEDFFIIEKNSTQGDCAGQALCFEPFFATTMISCPDGTSFPFEWLFLNYFVPLDAQKHFEVSVPSDQVPFDWKGALSGKNASGTQNQGYAHYSSLGAGVEDCDMGDVSWQATGVGSAPRVPHVGRGIVATVQKDSQGHVKITLTRA